MKKVDIIVIFVFFCRCMMVASTGFLLVDIDTRSRNAAAGVKSNTAPACLTVCARVMRGGGVAYVTFSVSTG